jgi:hypothetical protein
MSPMTLDRVARIIAAIALAAIVIGGFEPFYLRVFTLDPATARNAFTELPYRKLPGFRSFITFVDASTPARSRIVLLLPFTQWEGGYGYGFYRAGFLMPSKTVMPMLELNADRLDRRAFDKADYIAGWHGAPPVDGFVPIWRSPDGILLRRSR